jgi:hypothetical protein
MAQNAAFLYAYVHGENHRKMSTGLIRYDAMCRAIAVCHSVDEVKDIRDKARALEVYAAQALNLEAERKAAEIRIRAERKAGELLKEMKVNGQRHTGYGDQKSESSRSTPKAQTLTDLGISKTHSSQWQALADMSEPDFEAELAKPGKPTTEGVLAAHREPPKQMNPMALNAWGRIKDFERFELLGEQPQGLFVEMTAEMRQDVLRLSPKLIHWLSEFPGVIT